MSSILATVFFATYASAQLTTSIWLPGAANPNQTFVASIIGQSGDHTTLSLAFDDAVVKPSDVYSSAPDTVTVGGSTFAAYNATAVDAANTVVVALECSRAGTDAVPTCTLSTKGAEAAISELCLGLTGTPHATPVEGAAYCTDMAALTFDETVTLGGASQLYMHTHQLVITAGAEKLAATAAATPTTSGASATGSGSRPESEQAVSPADTPIRQSNIAARPMRTITPVLAGLGAAAAYFL